MTVSRTRVRRYALDLIRHRLAPQAPPSGQPDAWMAVGEFVEELRRLDAERGAGDGRMFEAAGRALVEEWGRAFPLVLESVRGRPREALDVLLRHVMKAFIEGPPEIHSTGLQRWQVFWPAELPPGFRRGILAGVAQWAGPGTVARPATDRSDEVSWQARRAPWRDRLRHAVEAARLPFLLATLLPVVVATAIAAQDGSFSGVWMGLTLLGVAAFHAGANALNDYYDHLTGADAQGPGPAPLTGGTRPLQRGLMAPHQLKFLAYGFYAVGVASGLVLVATRGMEVLWIGLAGFLLGFLYTAPPLRLAHRGLGELAIAVGFGPLIVMGTYFVQRQEWSLPALLASLPIAFLIAAVLYLNEFPDREGDARVGKRTLIVRLPERPAVIVYVVLLALTYLLILVGVSLSALPGFEQYAFPPWSLLGLLTFPLAARAALFLARNYRFPYRLVSANASTTLVHLSTGLLFVAGYLVPRIP